MSAIGGLLGLKGGASGTGYNVVPGTDPNQLAASYGGAQSSLAGQQQLLQALQAQGGINNQNQVYNQLQGVANGTGPNPAQAMLANATGQNVANQAALMAGQRGAGANVGLLARQAGQAGGALQQQAAGQGAALQAQQSLGAIGQAGQIAGQQVANQVGQTNANVQGQLGEQQVLQGANAQNNAIQGGLANTTIQGQQGLVGGLLGGVGAALHLAEGGAVDGGGSSFGKFFSQMGGGDSGASALSKGASAFAGGVGSRMAGPAPTPMTNAGFQMPVMGAQMAGQAPSLLAKGGNVGQKLKGGGKVPGKAKVEGNSYQNDNVKAMLSPGEGVIDRETMSDPGAVGSAARFVMAYVNHKKRK